MSCIRDELPANIDNKFDAIDDIVEIFGMCLPKRSSNDDIYRRCGAMIGVKDFIRHTNCTLSEFL